MEGARGVAIATTDEAFAEAVSRALSGIAHSGGAGKFVSVPTANPSRELMASMAATSAVIIDGELESRELGRRLASHQTLAEVSRTFRSGASESGVTQLLSTLRARYTLAPQSSIPVIVICADAPSDAFTQIALSCGADWVWPSRVNFKRLEDVVSRLSALKQQSSLNIKRPRVIVLENSAADINRLKGKLKDIFDLSCVGTQTLAASKLAVSADEAWSHFEQRGPFVAAIVDLALNKEDERRAAVEVGSEESATDSFLKPGQTPALSDRLQGILFVKKLLDSGSKIPIVVMSNYVRVVVMNRIKVELGDFSQNVIFLRKDAAGYKTLRAFLIESLSGITK